LQLKRGKRGITSSCLFRYRLAGKSHWMGIGSTGAFTLTEARARVRPHRQALVDKSDPLAARGQEQMAERLATARTITFDQCVTGYIADHQAAWRNAKHRAQWASTLATYVSPVFGTLPVSAIDNALVLRALKAIWHDKPETAKRIRGRLERILDWARVQGFRVGENPARWRGHLAHLLPAPGKIARVRHHAAMPTLQVPEFMAQLRAQKFVAARALEFLILCAARSGETLGAVWDEIDLDGKLWVVPPQRMKGGREHRVPLSPRALEILQGLPREGDFVFPGAKAQQPLNHTRLFQVLRSMRPGGSATTHGFRNSFAVWASERSNFPREVVEMALAHAIPNAVERAYQRSDLFERRRLLMNAWAEFCASPPSAADNVTPLRGRAS
jgi:integrase